MSLIMGVLLFTLLSWIFFEHIAVNDDKERWKIVTSGNSEEMEKEEELKAKARERRRQEEFRKIRESERHRELEAVAAANAKIEAELRAAQELEEQKRMEARALEWRQRQEELSRAEALEKQRDAEAKELERQKMRETEELRERHVVDSVLKALQNDRSMRYFDRFVLIVMGKEELWDKWGDLNELSIHEELTELEVKILSTVKREEVDLSSLSHRMRDTISTEIRSRAISMLTTRSHAGAEQRNSMSDLAGQTGSEFETWVAGELQKSGIEVQVQGGTGDQGIDLLAVSLGVRCAIQCKRWDSSVGNSAIQEIYAGKAFRKADIAFCVTNSTFTESARELAKELGVYLIDGSRIKNVGEEILRACKLTDINKKGGRAA